MEYYQFNTSFGWLALGEEDGTIVRLYLPGIPTPRLVSHSTPLLEQGQAQLLEYFSGTRRSFTLPLRPRGTDFQQKVWAALLEIPYGQTRTYGEIAQCVDKPRAARAVGMANHCNPIPILIPCHRVIGARGALTGYAGGLAQKKALLHLEESSNIKVPR